MGLFWAIIISVILALVIYGIIKSNLSEARKKKEREVFVQRTDGTIREGSKYNFHLADGKRLSDMEYLGPLPPDSRGDGYGWGDMLVLIGGDRKKVFIRRSAVRLVVET